MTLDTISRILSDAPSILAKLASLSIVGAAIGLLFNIFQTRTKRNQEEAARLRAVLVRLGPKIYTLEWGTLVRHPWKSEVLDFVDAVRKRIGPNPTPGAVRALVSAPLVFESMLQSLTRESNIVKATLEDSRDVGELQAQLGARVLSVHVALDAIHANLRLRMTTLLELQSVTTIKDFMSDASTATDAESELHALHQMLAHGLRNRSNSESRGFSEASKFLSEFCRAGAAADDAQLLRLWRNRIGLTVRIRVWKEGRNARREANKHLMKTLKGMLDSTTSDRLLQFGGLLKSVLDRRVEETRLGVLVEASADRLSRILKRAGDEDLHTASMHFARLWSAKSRRDSDVALRLLNAKAQGVDDATLDLWIALVCNRSELLEDALHRGGDQRVSAQDVLERHGF